MKKKLLLVCMALLSLFGASARTNVVQFTDGFESYTLGPIGTQSPTLWSAWSGPASLTAVTTDVRAFEGTKSAYIGPNDASDALLLFGNKTTGVWTVKYQMYVPTAKSAYFHFQYGESTYAAGVVSGGSTLSTNFNTSGTVVVDGGAAISYPQGSWFPVEVLVDLDADIYTILINGVAARTGVYASELASIDFYSSGANNEYYLDNVVFETADAKTQLIFAAAGASLMTNGLVGGTNAGDYPTQAITDLNNAILTAQAVANEPTSTEIALVDAKSVLFAAVTTFKASVVFPFTMSTAANPVWYYIEGAGTAPAYGSLNKAIGVDIMTLKCLWASPNTSPAYQLFRFEQLPGTVTFKIVNMLFPNGGLLSTSSPIVSGTNSAAYWSFTKLTGADGDQYQIYTSNGVMLHLAQSGTYVVNWTAGYNSASALKFIAATPTEVTQAGNTMLTNPLAVANSLQTASPVGNNPGQYPSADKTTFQQTIDAVALVSANASATEAERLTALNSLISAINVFNTKLVLTSASKWYYIVSANSAYSLDKVMVDNATVDNKINWTTEAIDTKQAWAFVPSTGGKFKIKNNASGKYITSPTAWSNSLMAVAGDDYALSSLTQAQFNITGPQQPLHAASNGSEVVCWTGGMSSASAWKIKEIVPVSQTITFADIAAKQVGNADFSLGATTDATGVTLTYVSSNENIATVDAAGLVHITATAAGTTNITVSQAGNVFYTAATPVMKVLTVGGPNGLKSVDDQVTVTAKNRMLVITGTTQKAQAFTVTGAQVDAAKALNAGIYIVKVAGKTLKVNVQ